MADLKSKQIKFPLTGTSVVSSSAQIATDISGSFVADSGSFSSRITTDSGSFSTRVTTAESELGNTLVSSSAQIATDISGSFVADSGSFSARITTDSGSFSTRVTTAETELTNTLVSSSAQIATDISGSFVADSGSFSTRVTTAETELSNTLVSSSAQIATDISGSFVADSGSFSTRVTTAESELTNTLVSSSAQIATDISGSFVAPSASFSTRVTTEEGNVDTLQARDLIAGAGLTGGGTLAADRTFTVGAGTGVTVNANDVAIGQAVATTSNVKFNHITGSGNISGSLGNILGFDSITTVSSGSFGTNLGVGTTTPAESLEVIGAISASTSGSFLNLDVDKNINTTNLYGTILTATQATIDHDSLANFVADEHVVHGDVSIVAGTGLTGGGTIAANRTLNVIGGDGITANANDIAITAAQTTIESIYKADLVIGEDAQTKIDFETANEIHFDVNNIELLNLAGSTISGSTVSTGSFGSVVTDGNVGVGVVNPLVALQVVGAISGSTSGSFLNVKATNNINATNLYGTVLTATQATIDHDSLANFVANEHIDHSSVSVVAGAGLTGGGTIAANRTINVVGGTGITANANEITTTDGEIVHDSLSGFVANEHIDHSGVSVTAGTGLTGGGTIAATRTLNVIGGDGITANANDIAITPAQTTITSLLATDIKIGEDDETKIDFETANEIHLYAANAEQVYVADGILGPETDSDVDLGTTGVRFKDAYVDSVTTTGNVAAATITTTGNITAQGDIIAENYIVSSSVTYMTSSAISGSSLFGDTQDDTHQFTGSVFVSGSTFNIDENGGVSSSASGSFLNVKATNNVNATNLYGTILTATQATIDHDSLANFVANEHIDHSAVSVVAGAGLTGGGTIAANRTINVVGGDGITANANDIAITAAQTTIESIYKADLVIGEDNQTQIDFETANEIHFDVNNVELLNLVGSKISGSQASTGSFGSVVTDGNVGIGVVNPSVPLEVIGDISSSASGSFLNVKATNNVNATNLYGTILTATQATIDHDSLANFVADEHVVHGDVSVIAGTGLTGGGTIAANRTLNVIGGDGITANANDIAITAAQTTITSVLAEDLKLGEDAQTKIDFETANEIHFDVNNVETFNMAGLQLSGSQASTGSFGSVVTDGNVGIGVVNPLVALEIIGAVSASTSGSFLNASVTDNISATNFYGTVLTATQATIDHDSLANFVADEHIVHGDVSVIAGTGLTGGGTIAANRTLNVIGGDGITANANDIAITPAQTTITSIYATDLLIGEDAQTKIDFETANEIHFDINNVETFNMAGLQLSGSQASTGSFGSVVTDANVGIGVVNPKESLEVIGSISGSQSGSFLNIDAPHILATNVHGTILTATQATIDHDSLANFVADEHVVHGDVSVIAGTGLTGGGTIAANRTLNVIGGDGITANANDIAITAAQTTIESIYKADLVIGEDAQTKIDFETANEIHFDVNNVETFNMTGAQLSGSEASSGSFGYMRVVGNITGSVIEASGDVIAFGSSDRELKDNIQPIENPLEKLNKIGGYTFIWNDKQSTYKGKDVGVVAQEIQSVLPEIVASRANGYLGVKYEKIVPLLIESIKELNKKIKHIEENCECLNK